MTQERKEQFVAVAFKDEETAKKLLAMEPAAVAEYLKGEGYDFTTEEVIEVGEDIKALQNQGELSADELDGVAGGKGSDYLKAGIVLGMVIGISLGGW